MTGIRNFVDKLSKSQKLICIILILGFILFLTIGIPTLARYRNRNTILTASVWDGSIATSYRKGTGTEDEPYVISNGSELAYFYTQLANNDYANTYFVLSNDIVLNRGIFNYDTTNGLQYVLDNQIYYLANYSNKYYDNATRDGTEVGMVNTFDSLNGFKGHFDGKSFTIFGLYVTSENNNELALFTNLQGTVHDLYVENGMVYGGTVTAGIASTTNNASLSNILFDGYVVGKSAILGKNINTTPNAPVINIQNTTKTDYIDLSNNIPFVGSEIVSTSITGNYVISGSTEVETSIKINGVTVSNGSFDISLGNSMINDIPVLTSTTSEGEVTLTFSNLSYNIVYNYAASGGIVAISNNTTIENAINKAYVYGYSTSGGIVGVTTSLININQSYNTGNIDSGHVSGGLIGVIEKSSNNVVIAKSYNSGEMVATHIGGLIGVIENNSGSVSISNVFNTSTTNYSIGTIENTVVNVTKAYFVNGPRAVSVGTTSGNFTVTSFDNLKTKNYAVNNLSFNEFVDFNDLSTNNQNVWVYEDDSLPILFIDDITNPIANINVSIYSWNNLSYELNTVKMDSNIAFNIETTNELKPVKEIYYYISNSTVSLTRDELSQLSSWTLYSGIVQISEEGFYVVYAKIVDYNNNVTYINTDLLTLDLSGPSVNVSVGNSSWTSLRSDLDSLYLDRAESILIEASDSLSGIASIKYYITTDVLDKIGLDQLNDSSWTTYSNGILISEIGKYIVYIKVSDNFGHVTYVNTDCLIIDGYTESSLTVGRNSSSYLNESANITNKSTITLDVNYSSESAIELSGYTHNLVSNILLPLGSKITLIDNVKNKIYEYQITTEEDIYNYNNSCDTGNLDCTKVATIPFTLFKEIGTGSVGKYFVESTYYANGTVNENFTVVLDLSSTNISSNYSNVNLCVELHNSNGTNVRPTLYGTMKGFNIYSSINSGDAKASLYLTTNYRGGKISYNSNSTTDVNITSGINYKYANGYKVVDTTYENKNMGLSIKFVNSNGDIVTKNQLKNIIFKVEENIYYPDDDNIVRIDLGSGISDVTKTLTIITSENNSDLEAGIYYFKISNYASYDGNYYDTLGSNELSIPVSVSDNISKVKYSFDVIMDDSSRIINRTSDTANVSFDILQNGNLKDPNIRISLYKKDRLTAYDQSYSMVDLSAYVSNTLNNCEASVYYVSINPVQYNKYTKLYNNFVLNLITHNFENTGYKFVFDLYDGTKKIGTIEKHFIVK